MRLRWRSLIVVCSSLAVAGVSLFAPAQAQPQTRPQSPDQSSIQLPGQLVAPQWWWRPVDPRPTNEQLAAQLAELADRSRGRIEVRSIGDTNEGRPVWAARVGHGPLRIQYVAQQHGNEPLGAPAAVEFLRTIGVANTGWHRWLRSRITVDVVVRANPDGHVRNWRYNYDPDADPEFGRPGQGYDLNRYHNPDLDPDANPATEAGHIQRAYAGFRPHVVVDYHMQGRYRDADGREITASMMWPTHPDATAAAVAAAKQVVVVAERAITHLGRGNVSQYPGGDYEGIARNAYGLRGSASVLLELSNMGAEHEQAQIRSAYLAMLAITQTGADGSLRRINPDRADAIPPRGAPITSGDQTDAQPVHLDALD